MSHSLWDPDFQGHDRKRLFVWGPTAQGQFVLHPVHMIPPGMDAKVVPVYPLQETAESEYENPVLEAETLPQPPVEEGSSGGLSVEAAENDEDEAALTFHPPGTRPYRRTTWGQFITETLHPPFVPIVLPPSVAMALSVAWFALFLFTAATRPSFAALEPSTPQSRYCNGARAHWVLGVSGVLPLCVLLRVRCYHCHRMPVGLLAF